MNTYETTTLNTNILPIIDVCMYETPISPNYLAEDYYECLDDDDTRTSDDEVSFDNKAYCERIKAIAADIVKKEWLPLMTKYGIKDIIVGDFYQPFDYFNGNDCFEFRLVVEEDFEEKIKTALREVINLPFAQKYIEDNYTSREGFISLMPKTYEEMSDFDGVRRERNLASALTLISIYEGYDVEDETERLYEYVRGNVSYSEFTTWKDDK